MLRSFWNFVMSGSVPGLYPLGFLFLYSLRLLRFLEGGCTCNHLYTEVNCLSFFGSRCNCVLSSCVVLMSCSSRYLRNSDLYEIIEESLYPCYVR